MQKSNVQFENRKDGHYYSEDEKVWYPSVTAVLRHYPKGEKFYEWVARNGYNAENIKKAAGDVGTTVHNAIEKFVQSGDLCSSADDLGPEEYMAVLGFSRWYASRHPTILAQELPVISHRMQVGGTVDIVATIDDSLYVIDLKTSRHIGSTFWLQLHAYAHCLCEMKKWSPARLMVLHLNPIYDTGYREVARPYRHDVLRQFYALRYLHDHVARNDRTRTEEQECDDKEWPGQGSSYPDEEHLVIWQSSSRELPV